MLCDASTLVQMVCKALKLCKASFRSSSMFFMGQRDVIPQLRGSVSPQSFLGERTVCSREQSGMTELLEMSQDNFHFTRGEPRSMGKWGHPRSHSSFSFLPEVPGQQYQSSKPWRATRAIQAKQGGGEAWSCSCQHLPLDTYHSLGLGKSHLPPNLGG